MTRDRRQKRDLHALNDDGMVLCNPRDKEAAHRAEMEGIATGDRAAVTCRKCLSLLFELEKGHGPVVTEVGRHVLFSRTFRVLP
jgi:hypothetical protein